MTTRVHVGPCGYVPKAGFPHRGYEGVVYIMTMSNGQLAISRSHACGPNSFSWAIRKFVKLVNASLVGGQRQEGKHISQLCTRQIQGHGAWSHHVVMHPKGGAFRTDLQRQLAFSFCSTHGKGCSLQCIRYLLAQINCPLQQGTRSS